MVGGELLIISCFGPLETVAKTIQETMDAEFSNFLLFLWLFIFNLLTPGEEYPGKAGGKG